MSSSGGMGSKHGHAIELTSRSKTGSHVHHDERGFVHMKDVDEISEPPRNGSVHGSEKELVGHNIMIKQEYEVREEEQQQQTRGVRMNF